MPPRHSMARFLTALLLGSALLAIAPQQSHAAAPSTSEEFWHMALPDTPLPDAVRWYLAAEPDTSSQGTTSAGDDAHHAADEERLSTQWPYYFYTLKQQGSASPNKPTADDTTERLSQQWPYYFYTLKKQGSASPKPAIDNKPGAADDTAERMSQQWPYYFYSLKQQGSPATPKPATTDDTEERLSRQWPYYFYSLIKKQGSASTKPAIDNKQPAAADNTVERLSQQWPYYFYSLIKKQGSAITPKPTIDTKLPAATDDTEERLSQQWPYYFYSLIKKQISASPKPSIDNKRHAAADDTEERLSRQWPYYFYSLIKKQGSASPKPTIDNKQPTATDDTVERLSQQWPYYFYSLKQTFSSPSHKSADAGSSASHSHMPAAAAHNREAKMNHSAMFFFEDALQVGRRLPFHFPQARRAPLGMLPRKVADSIPFSTSELPGVLARLGVAAGSSQAAEMEETLSMCEATASTVTAEGRFCATSLEALVEHAMAALGTRGIRPIMSDRPRSGAPWQPYTVRAVRPVAMGAAAASRFVACHNVVYPYTVYRCHDTGLARLYMVEMEGTRGGGSINEAVICHIDTSQWKPDHISFKVLGTKPGGPPICHTMPYGHIVWAKNEDDGRHSSA